MAGKRQNLAPMWKKLMKDVDVEEPTSFLDHVDLGCTQRECKNKRENHWTIQQDVRVPYFCWSNRKITRMGLTSRENFGVVPRHGRTCSKMRGTILRSGKIKRQSNYTSFLVLVWMITESKRKNLKIKVNCQKFAPILHWNACTWHELETTMLPTNALVFIVLRDNWFTKRRKLVGRKNGNSRHPDRRLCEPHLSWTQSRSRLLGEPACWRKEEDHRCKRKQDRKLEGGARLLGRQHQDWWKQWLWCCDQRRGLGHVDHNHQNCRTFEKVYRHGGRSGGCQCSQWNLGPRAGEKHRCESRQSMHRRCHQMTWDVKWSFLKKSLKVKSYYKSCVVRWILLVLWMWAAQRVVVARVRNFVARVSGAFCLQNVAQTHVVAYASSPVLTGRMYRRPSITKDEWREKKKIFDERESDWSCHAPISPEAKNIRGILQKYCWTSSVRNEIDWVGATTQTCIPLTPLLAWTKLEDWKRGKETKIKLRLNLEAACRSLPKQYYRCGQRTRRTSGPHYIRLWRQSTRLGTFSVGSRMDTTKLHGAPRNAKNMKSLQYDIEVPCMMQWELLVALGSEPSWSKMEPWRSAKKQK